MIVNHIPHMEPEDLVTLLVLFGADRAEVTGDNVQANRCPFHNNDSPTLGISVDFPYPVNCFNPACSARSPDVLSLVARFLNTDPATAVSWLYTKFPHLERVKKTTGGLFKLDEEEEVEDELPTLPVATMYAYAMDADNDIGYRAAEYYNDWSIEDCDKMGLGYDRKNHRLIFPVYNGEGELVGIIGRNMQENINVRWYNYDGHTFKLAHALLGDHLSIDLDYPVTVCEGPSDYYQMMLLEVPNPRSIMGAKFSDWQVAKLASYGHPVNIVFDKDKAGHYAAKKIAERLRATGCRVRIISTPEGVDDPRELTKQTLDEFMTSVKGDSIFNVDR